MPRLLHLYLSPRHNFFGHHGKPPGQAPVLEQDQLICLAGRGIQGDRFLDYKPDYRGQITFFSAEVYERLLAEFGLSRAEKPPSVFRRNVIVSGVALNDWIGQEFELSGVRFQGTSECAPCYWMDQALGPGAEKWLKGQGGLRARILTSGTLTRS